MDDDPPIVLKILKDMHESGKGIVGMKIFGAGRLCNRMDECLRYVLSLECIDAFTIGQENRSQLVDLVKRIPDAGSL